VRVQRQEHLPVWEPRRQPVCGVHRERRLPNPGHPIDRMDPDYNANAHRCLSQLRKLTLPAGKTGDITGQGPCCHPA
jgi:hypothetical protein